MAIFSRRDVQAAIYQSKDCLTANQLKDLVGRLNGRPSGVLGAEWEAVVLAALSNCGRISRVKHGGTKEPDVFFRMGQSGSLEFAADITTVSDAHAHEENPYEQFRNAIQRFLKKAGTSSAGLNFDIKHTEQGEYGNRKLRLALPAKAEMDSFVKTELGIFLSGIAKVPDTDAVCRYDQKGICFSLRYDAKKKHVSSSRHSSYTVPYSLQKNTLSNALDDKRKQLKKSGYIGLKGVIVCDGGCDALNERSHVGGAFGCQDLVHDFLDSQSSISWILVLRIESMHSFLPHEKSIEIKPKLYWKRAENGGRFRDTASVFHRMLEYLPQPEATPMNALHWLKGRNGNMGRPIGTVTMQDKAIKFSARVLTEVLAGKIDHKLILEDHDFKHVALFFERQLREGRTLRNSFVERDEHRDDDWIVLEYEGPDTALVPYRVPEQ